jgi:hypothetical protein
MKIFWLMAAVILSLWIATVEGAQYLPDSTLSPNIPRKSELVPTGETNAVCIGNTPGVAPSVTLCSTINVTGKTLLFKIPEVVYASLPASHALSIVTDCDTSSCTAGGGTTRMTMYWNGSAWAPLPGSGTGTGSGDLTDVLATTNEICVSNPGGPSPQVSLCPTVVATGKTVQLGRTDLASILTPAQITAQTNDYNPTGLSTASTLRLTTNASQNLTGIQGTAAGRILTIWNAGSFPLVLINDNGAAPATGSTAANRFALGADIALGPSQAIMLQYDNTSGRWRALGGVGAGGPKYCSSSTGNDSYACSLSPAISAYTVGEHYFFHADVANTSSAGKPTLALNGLAAIVIVKSVGGYNTALTTNDIRANQIVQLVYDGTYFQMQSQIGNSPTGISGLTTGNIPSAASATSLQNSGLAEDADSFNFSKSLEVGDVSTNSWEWIGTGVSGHVQMKFNTARIKTLSYTIDGARLADTTTDTDVWENTIVPMHITAVKCRTDTGTATINLQRNDGSAADILSSNLTCTTGGASSTTFASGEDAIAVGNMIDSVVVDANASGTPTKITVTVNMQVDSGQ